MSLFICDKCGCVDNTSCNHPPYDMVGIDPTFPNMHSMEMAGFREDEDGNELPRVASQLLCSECNTGKWHGEFSKKKATAVEIEMGKQLNGEKANVFTFHPMWREYSNNPDMKVEEVEMHRPKVDGLSNTPRRARTLGKTTFKKDWISPGEAYVRETPKIGRNSDCPCGSGEKYKKCCLRESK